MTSKTHTKVNGLNVLRLRGSHYEMGRQHGEALRDQVPHGPVPYYGKYLQRLLRQTGLGRFAPLAADALHLAVGRKVARALPDFAKDSVRGMADGSGIPYAELERGCVLPDTLLWAAARMMQVKRVPSATAHRMALGLGCSSAIAWGSASADGRLMHARNLDFHGVKSWPDTAAVAFHEPTRGQRYVSITAAGVPMGGHTAMNEAGLTLTVHQHMFTDKTRLGGTPIGVVGDIVMREARNLDEAEEILSRYTPIGCWTYLIADGNTKQVLCWEESPLRRTSRRTSASDTSFSYANIYFDQELGADERALYGSYWRHNLARQKRLRVILAEGAGGSQLTPQGMAKIIGDTGTTSCRIHESIAMLMTVASVVFRPEDGAFWVATGEAPVSHHPFQPFSLKTQAHAPELGVLAGGEPDPIAKQAFAAYRRAYIAYFDESDLPTARRLCDEARAAQPTQPLYHVVAGLLALNAGDTDAAASAFDQALALGHPDRERVAAAHLWRGRTDDVRGDRAGAARHYHAALAAGGDAPVDRAARKNIVNPYPARKTARIDVDFAFADVIAP